MSGRSCVRRLGQQPTPRRAAPVALPIRVGRTPQPRSPAGEETRTRSSRRRILRSSPERGSPTMNAVVAKLRELESPGQGRAYLRLAGLVDQLELKEGYTGEHTPAVGRVAVAIATE